MLIDYYTDDEVNKMFEEIEEINFLNEEVIEELEKEQQEMFIDELENEMLEDMRVRQYEEEEYMLFGL